MNEKFDKNQPILTIGIPTYNRPEAIKKQIRLLLPQLNERVHLVVYDNCSDTPIKEYFTDHELSKFTLIRNSVNVGGDANIARCFENSETKWLWTLSDDDFINSDAIEVVLKKVEQNSNSVLINLNHYKDSMHKGFEDFIKDLNSMESYGDSFWMSKCVYNIEELKPYLFYYFKNLSSMIGQVVFVLKYLENNPNGVIVRCKDVVIEYNSPDISWNYSDYIKYTSLVFEIFDREKYSILDKTLFKSMVQVYLIFIYRLCDSIVCDSKHTHHLLNIVRFRFGFWNLICNFPLLYFRIKLKSIMPKFYTIVYMFYKD